MGGTDEKQNEYKSLRTRREPATAPAWALSWGIEMAKTENRKPKTENLGIHKPCICICICKEQSRLWISQQMGSRYVGGAG